MCHVIVGFYVLLVDVSLDLGFHVVIGFGRLTVQQVGFIRQFHFTANTQFQAQSFIFLNMVVRLCLVIINSICIPKFCIFCIAKTGPLRCCLYTLRRLQWTAVSCKRSSCNEIRWIFFLKTIFGGFRQSTVNNGSPRSFPKLCLSLPWHSEFLGRPPGFLPLPPSKRRTRCWSPLFVIPVRNGIDLVSPASWCERFNVDNAWLKSERFLIGWVSVPDLLKEIHQLFL